MQAWSPPNTEHPPPKVGEPPLHRAARVGDVAEVRRLVAAGSDVNAVFNIGLDPGAYTREATPLMVASGSGDGADVQTVRTLLELGADPKLMLGGQSAASFACRGLGWNYRPGGDAIRLRLLLEAGSPLPTDPGQSNLVLCEAAAAGDVERLGVLLAHGLNPGGHFDPEAARRSHEAMMRQMGDDPAERSESMKAIHDQMLASAISAPSDFKIPLFRAAESGSAECVRMLLAAGADARVRDSSSRTAMYYASSADVVRILIDAGLPLEDADTYGWSPLGSAVTDEDRAISRVRTLLDAGANVNATHDRGYTVFMSAVGSGRQPQVLRMLVAAGADPHAVSDLGYNAFHAAIDVNGEANNEESVRDTLSYLKQLGVAIEHRNRRGQTPLARALENGNGTVVRVLCELGANPNALGPKHECGGERCTRIDLPLLFHAADGVGVDRDVKTEALLAAGADPLVTDAEGHTALVHVVAALCRDSTDYEGAFRSFFEGLKELRLAPSAATVGRQDFIAQAKSMLRTYTEEFASRIPVRHTCEYDEEWRRERIACISLLCAYEGWKRRSHWGHSQTA